MARAKRKARTSGLSVQSWCPERESNSYRVSPTTTSTLRVYHFATRAGALCKLLYKVPARLSRGRRGLQKRKGLAANAQEADNLALKRLQRLTLPPDNYYNNLGSLLCFALCLPLERIAFRCLRVRHWKQYPAAPRRCDAACCARTACSTRGCLWSCRIPTRRTRCAPG